MSDEGERTCPLCAEEMDLTDQQLKPCKCGYEICIWCWHHIMDMAEKDDTEGRCPACRTPYNKEKIVGTAANCERLVAEMNLEKKFKTQKGKIRSSEGRKQLSSVRVIQRNLVYIVGLPLNLADEELLQRKEYFGQYGKVMKVSISRTAAGTIQHFANNTCSVYITYLKEDEAVRCIQSVHGFVLEGRSLRACFGTTKYCHAWLRNVSCNNPDCLYLHEIGSQEDSFTKDEIISAYTRSRVQQITGATNSMQRRSGNVLPPPADEYCNNISASSGKSINKPATNNLSSCTKISPPNSSSGRSVALPAGASWGTRASNNQPTPILPSSNGPQKQKPDTCNGSVSFSAALASSNHIPLSYDDGGRKLLPAEENNRTQVERKLMSETVKQNLCAESVTSVSNIPSPSGHPTTITTSGKLYGLPTSRDKDKHVILSPKVTNCDDTSSESSGSGSLRDSKDDIEEKVQNLSSDMLSMSIDDDLHRVEQVYLEPFGEHSTSQTAGNSVECSSEICVPKIKSGSGWGSETPGVQAVSCEEKDDLLSFDDQRLKDPEFISDASYLVNGSHSLSPPQNHRGYSPLVNGPFNVNGDLHVVDNKVDPVSQLSGTPVLSGGYPENQFNSFASLANNVEHSSYLLSNDEISKRIGKFDSEVSSAGCNVALDVGESSIISNILSLDFDSWDESLTSPQNLAKFLGETDRQQQGSHRGASPWKVQQSNQSRFSFAREDESINQAPDGESSLGYISQAFKPHYFGHDIANSTSFHLDKFGARNGMSLANAEEADIYTSSHSLFNSSKLPVSRSQVSAPPGFSTPSRAPPPGFMSHERIEQTYNSFSGHNMLETSTLRSQYQPTQPGNMISNGDIEFMDPAILAVGKGRLPDGLSSSSLEMRPSFPQLNNLENDARIQLLMQRSLSTHHNQRFNDMGDTFSSLADSFRNPSRVMEQSLVNNIPFSQVSLPQSRNPLMSHGHWDGWNEVQSANNLGMAELLRPDRLGYNKFYNGYEDSNLRMPSQGDLYNRTFGI
ncbi:hypothetical protein ACH5RR_020885 [Cinchona calisaya]|uniref:CCR4-NOT transcription complex subunit 4 n=1 Tax=Cinchona calisaya TaxID=153742 RepID=A0ABD2ZFS7_9GENT